MEQQLHRPAEQSPASDPPRERYDARVLGEWPRLDAPPRVWIGSLLDYEAGLLHGRWVGVGRPAEDIQEDINGMLSRSPIAERTRQASGRWAIFDVEGFGEVPIEAHHDVGELSRIGLRIRSFGGAFATWARLREGDLSHHLRFRDVYLGHFDSVRDYVEILVDARNYERVVEEAVPSEIRPYVSIDIAQLTADMIEYGDVLAIENPDGGVWIFDGRQPA